MSVHPKRHAKPSNIVCRSGWLSLAHVIPSKRRMTEAQRLSSFVNFDPSSVRLYINPF